MPQGGTRKILGECAFCWSVSAFFMLFLGAIFTGVGFSIDDEHMSALRIVGVTFLSAGIFLTILCVILCVIAHVMGVDDDRALQTNQTQQPIISGVAPPQHPEPGALGNQMHSYQVTYPAVGYSVACGVNYPQTGSFEPERQSQMYPPADTSIEQSSQSVDPISQASSYSQPSAPPHRDNDQPPSYQKVVLGGYL